MRTKLISGLQNFTVEQKDSIELSQVVDAYKYYLMYGAEVETKLWTQRQQELYRILTQDEQNSEDDIITG